MIASILDTDKYKLTMQQAVRQLYPHANARYQFINRRSTDKSTPNMFRDICEAIQKMQELSLTIDEYEYLKKDAVFKEDYLQFLRSYRFDPNQVSVSINSWGKLSLDIEGKWADAILWEVPLMAIISECYFQDKPSSWSPYR